MTQLRVYLLGSPRVERDGVPLELTTRKALALLAYLAVTGTPHTRDALAVLFWPEADAAHARGALRYTLAMLKTALGAEWLVIAREQIGLAQRRDLQLDVARLDQLLAQWQAHGHPPEMACPDCVPLLREAVALQRGPFLAGFTLPDSSDFDDWHFFETERLQRAQMTALATLVTYHRGAGTVVEAIPYAQRWLALDPLQEGVHRLLMQLYADASQPAAALRQYAACAQLLEAELGVTPAPETTALYEQIRTDALKAKLPAALPQPLPIQPTPLLGRADEVRRISQHLATPTCRLLTLVGPGVSAKPALDWKWQPTSSTLSPMGSASSTWRPSATPTWSSSRWPRPSLCTQPAVKRCLRG